MQMRKLRLRKERPFTQEPKLLKGRAFGGLVCSTKVTSWHHLQACHDRSRALGTSSVKPEHVTGWLWRVGGRFWMGSHTRAWPLCPAPTKPDETSQNKEWWTACGGGPGGPGSQAHVGPPQCSWQSPHREMGHDDLNAGCGPTSGQSKQAVGPATSPARRHRPGITHRCCTATRWLEPTTSASRKTWAGPLWARAVTRTPATPPCSGLFSPLLPRPGALGKLSPSNLHCPSGLLITEPSGPTDL